MLAALAFIVMIAGAVSPASARQFGGDLLARKMYEQWEHAAVHTSRSLMTASGPAGPSHECPATKAWMYETSTCQPEGGKNVSMVMQPNTCVSLKDLKLDWAMTAYKYSSPPSPQALQFFMTPNCQGEKSVGLEGLVGMQKSCPDCKGQNPVGTPTGFWNFGNFELLEPLFTNHIDFNKQIQSVWYYCPSTGTS